jgi:hypothetical protein
MKRIIGALLIALAVTVALIAEGPKVYTVYRNTKSLTLTDTLADTLNATVTTGLVNSRGLRANGANFKGYVTGYITVGADDDSVWFDTAVTMVRSHPAGFVVATKTRTATVFRLTCTGAHFDSLLGTIMAATDSMTIDFDSTGKTTRHRVGTCDSAISATVVALRLTQATADADSFYVGWTAKPTAYHATIRDDVDSVCTHTLDADTTWGNRSFDSMWVNTSRAHAVTGWQLHGLKRGGDETIVWDTSDIIQIPPANNYFVQFACYKMSEKESTGARMILQNRMYMDSRPGDNWVNVCSSGVLTDTTAPFADTARLVLDNLGEAFRVIAWDVDSQSAVAYYGQIDWFGLTCFIVARY